MKKSLVVLWSIFLIGFISGAMDPAKGYCEHQGYIVEKGNCVFDDGNKCNLMDFLFESCGQEYMGDFLCRNLGEIVFSQFEECCEGKPYLSSGMMGQESCRDFNYRLKNDLKYNFAYQFGVLIILGFLIYLIYRIIKKRK